MTSPRKRTRRGTVVNVSNRIYNPTDRTVVYDRDGHLVEPNSSVVGNPRDDLTAELIQSGTLLDKGAAPDGD